MQKPRSRVWEIIPGLLTWLTLILPIIISFYQPTVVITIVLAYATYWLIKVLTMTVFLVAGFARYKSQRKIRWEERLKQSFPDRYQSLYHLAIIPTYKEDISILHHTLGAIQHSHYDPKKLIVVVAFEERDQELAPKYMPILNKEYKNAFGQFITTLHPANIPGEVRGKGPNITWAGRRVKEKIEELGIAHDQVIVTTLDADNRVDPNYFANVSWAYLNDNDPIHKSFQPLPMFFNNVWKVPLPVKMTALGSTFWQIIQAMRPHYLRNFSAHAQSLAALVETDFWSVTTVVEDGHQYWRSFFRFDGNHQVIPIFSPVYMDAVQGETLTETFREQYLQRRRWFWGVSDIPYVFAQSRRNGRIPFFYKWAQFARLVDSHFSLSTQSFILLMGWFPIFVNSYFRLTVLGYNFPTIYQLMMTTAWIAMIANMAVASLLVPPRPGRKRGYYGRLAVEWLLAPIMLPVTGILFSALPAIDSQTRLMLNKPFTVFNVTKKIAVTGGILRVGD